jgi:tryptophan synthase alpha chain
MPGYDEGLFEAGTVRKLAVVPVIAPSVLPERLDQILALESPFLYAAIRTGITGQRSEIDAGVRRFLDRIRRRDTALIAGFGISEHSQAEKLREYADILVVGSAFVRALHEALGTGKDVREAAKQKTLEIIGRTDRVGQEKTTHRQGNT